MQDYITHDNDPFSNLPIYTAEDWHRGAGDYWRELLMKRWEERNYIGILTEKETDSDHLWRMPDWASNILDVLANEQYIGVVPNWMDAVIVICLGEVDNLQEINWGQATEGWHYSVFDNILACITDERLAVAILQCAIKEAEADFSVDYPSDKSAVVTYCQKQIEYLQSRDMFDLATILQADRVRLEDVEKRLGEVESRLASITTQIPAELSSRDAQAILKRAVDAGLCEQVQGGRYKWLKSAELFGYFVSEMRKKRHGFSKGDNIDWTKWCYYFVIDEDEKQKAKQKINNMVCHMGKNPDGYELIDVAIRG